MKHLSRRWLKTLLYRICSFNASLLIIYLWTGKFLLSAGIVVSTHVFKIFLYYAWELLWENNNEKI